MLGHGRKNLQRGIDIILLLSIVSILFIYNISIPVNNEFTLWENIPQEQKVVGVKNKYYNKHILTYSELCKLYACRPEERMIDSNILEFNIQDAQLLMKIARAEGGDTLNGQLWVIRTIINRLQSEQFPDTIYEIISAESQFEVFIKGTYKIVELNNNSHIALAMIESGWDETDGALYFEASTNTKNSWHAKNLQFIKEVEGQRYYK